MGMGGAVTMGAGPMTGGDPMATDPGTAAGMNPMAAGGEGPNADPAAGGEEFAPMGDAADVPEDAPVEGEPEGKGDSTEDIINQLSQDDREAVRAYAQSMLNRDKSVDGEVAPPEVPGTESTDTAADSTQQSDVMMEMTKSRLQRVQKYLSESFPIDGERESMRKVTKKTQGGKKRSYGSPFSSPRK